MASLSFLRWGGLLDNLLEGYFAWLQVNAALQKIQISFISSFHSINALNKENNLYNGLKTSKHWKVEWIILHKGLI
jgi:hypothetical protein